MKQLRKQNTANIFLTSLQKTLKKTEYCCNVSIAVLKHIHTSLKYRCGSNLEKLPRKGFIFQGFSESKQQVIVA